MTNDRPSHFEINWVELWKALGTLAPDHVSGQPEWIEYIKHLAADTDFYYSDELHEAAEGHSGQEGAETYALFVACHWLKNVKADFLSNAASKVTSREVAKLHLVRLDELIPKLVKALLTPVCDPHSD